MTVFKQFGFNMQAYPFILVIQRAIIPIATKRIPTKLEESLLNSPIIFPVIFGERHIRAPKNPKTLIAIKTFLSFSTESSPFLTIPV